MANSEVDINFLHMLLALVMVLLIFVSIAWLVRKVSDNRYFLPSKMSVVSSIFVGKNERVVLIDVGDQQMLLGVSPGGVSLLKTYDEPVADESDALVDRASATTPQFEPFQAMFKRLLGNEKKT